ncbi:thioredoxin domain-containing protein [Candidatus Roizmanbacteria bacterium]|nr:thioredoxin domain-containing protein [Candidatus Roizmanbacteria bacterium]
MSEKPLTSAINSSEIENIKSTNRILIVALIVASFFLGSLTNKVSSLENNKASGDSSLGSAAANPTTPPPAAPSITNDTIKTWAKDLALNTESFNSCLDEEKYKTNVEDDSKAGQGVQVNGTPTFFINGIAIVGAQPFSAFQEAIDKELAGTTDASAIRATVDTGRLPSIGDTNAKVTIVEFSDFECPFCRRYFTDTFPQLKKDYIDTGKVVMYYRHFPLDFHPLAKPFAMASECANEQGKFWEFHDKIFSEQG